MEYKLVSGMSAKELVKNVNEEINNGYKPHGGISCSEGVIEGFYTMLQAMIKE